MLHQQPGQEKRAKQPESVAVASNTWLKAVKVSVRSGDRVHLDRREDGSCSSWSLAFGVFLQNKAQGHLRIFFARDPENTARFQRYSGGFAWVNVLEE